MGDDAVADRKGAHSAIEDAREIAKRITRANLTTIVSAFKSESDVKLLGIYGELIAAHAYIAVLEDFSKDKHLGLALLSEWELVRRQVEALWLIEDGQLWHLAEDKKQSEEATQELRKLAGRIRSDLFTQFVESVRSKVDVEIPQSWRDTIVGLDSGSHYIYPTDESRDATRECMLSQMSKVDITISNETAIVEIRAATKAPAVSWTVNVPAGVNLDDIHNVVASGKRCYIIWNLDKGSVTDLTISAFEQGHPESIWTQACFHSYWLASKVEGVIAALPVVSQEKATLTVFYVCYSSVGIDVLDVRDGKRRWCFSSKLPRQFLCEGFIE